MSLKTHLKKITWNKVTWYSQTIAIVLAVVIFCVGFYLGRCFENNYGFSHSEMNSHMRHYMRPMPVPPVLHSVVFNCDAQKTISAQFRQNAVSLKLSDGRTVSLPQVMSGSGARYANSNESFVFWNKGNTAFIQEQGTTTYSNCVTP